MGPLKYDGCPDTDGDGIPDNHDKCPVYPGPASNNGCPVDGVPDSISSGKSSVYSDSSVVDVDVSTPILFDINRTTIKEESLPVLIKAAREIKAGNDITIRIEGYTDNTGNTEYNKGLSISRAMVVKLKLVDMGVDFKKIKIAGYGEDKPIAPNDTPEGRRRNRRAVMKLRK